VAELAKPPKFGRRSPAPAEGEPALEPGPEPEQEPAGGGRVISGAPLPSHGAKPSAAHVWAVAAAAPAPLDVPRPVQRQRRRPRTSGELLSGQAGLREWGRMLAPMGLDPNSRARRSTPTVQSVKT
jgi:hypothetical protein